MMMTLVIPLVAGLIAGEAPLFLALVMSLAFATTLSSPSFGWRERIMENWILYVSRLIPVLAGSITRARLRCWIGCRASSILGLCG